MANVSLSHAEKTFILHGVKNDMRNDGRTRTDYRSFEIETDVVSQATGSARVRLANTDILVGVKAELGSPSVDRPDKGRLQFFVDCSANAAPAFQGRGGEELANDISCVLARAFDNGNSLDLRSLCVAPGQHCWVLYIDVLLLECGGNLYDTVSLAVKSALHNTRIPNLLISTTEDGRTEIDLSDDPYDHKHLNVENAPLLITLTKIGQEFILDASMEEEACALYHLMVGVTHTGHVTCTKKLGIESLLPESLFKMLTVAKETGIALNAALVTKLNEEMTITDRKTMAFLH